LGLSYADTKALTQVLKSLHPYHCANLAAILAPPTPAAAKPAIPTESQHFLPALSH
jgi:hypothetical protein